MSAVDLLSNTGYILYNKQIARLFGINEAIILGELCAKFQFFSDAGQLEDGDGWFYLTREDIENDTCLSPRQQRPALENLGKNGLVECERREVPARMFYRLKIENLNNLILQNVTSGCNKMSQQAVTKCKIINKESNKENNKENIYCAFEPFFEQLWAMYPNKKGKGQISPTHKAKLEKIGFEQLKRCIERYMAGLEKEPWRKPQNGSTFFHSGYIDYLDENYTEDEIDKDEFAN